MKKSTCLLLAVPFIFACQKMYSPQILNLPATEEGTIYIRSSGFGDNYHEAYADAVKHAFNTLLFQGIPESIQSRPMIEDGSKARQQHPDLFSCFENNSCYQQFLTSAAQPGQRRYKVKNGWAVSTDIKINIRALRSYLEQNNVIRKFGY